MHDDYFWYQPVKSGITDKLNLLILTLETVQGTMSKSNQEYIEQVLKVVRD